MKLDWIDNGNGETVAYEDGGPQSGLAYGALVSSWPDGRYLAEVNGERVGFAATKKAAQTLASDHIADRLSQS
jgi:hypothetical protein